MAKRKTKIKSDPWRDQLDAMLLEFHNAFYDSLSQWFEADEDDADALEEGAGAIDPVGSATTAKAVLGKIESWLREQADVFLESVDSTGKSKNLRKRLPLGWLSAAMQSHVIAAQASLKQCKDAADECVEFSQENNGIGGFLRGAFKGAMNPADGIASLFGEGSINKEGNRIGKSLKKAANQLDDTVSAADAALDELIVTKWNIEVITLAEDEDADNKQRDA